MAYSMMDGGSGSAKKMAKPGVAKRVSDRKAFVSEKKASKGITDKQANQRFFVQTRMAEMLLLRCVSNFSRSFSLVM